MSDLSSALSEIGRNPKPNDQLHQKTMESKKEREMRINRKIISKIVNTKQLFSKLSTDDFYSRTIHARDNVDNVVVIQEWVWILR